MTNAEFAPGPGDGDDLTERTLALIGQRIRDLRKARNMTLQSLADATGLSASMLSLVERGLASPSIGSLIVIGDALGKSLAGLVGESNDTREELVTRGRDAQVINSGGVVARILRGDTPDGVQIVLREHLAQSEVHLQPSAQSGQVYGVVVEGMLIVEIDETSHILHAGDLISCPPDKQRRLWNPGPGLARSIWFNLSSGSALPAELLLRG